MLGVRLYYRYIGVPFRVQGLTPMKNRRPARSCPPFGRPGCALNRPTWSPIKGSSARVSPNRLSYGCPTTIFGDPRNRHRHHLSATLLDGRGGNGCAWLLRCGRDRLGGGFPNAGYEPHPSCDDCSLTARIRPKRAAKTSRKIAAGQQ